MYEHKKKWINQNKAMQFKQNNQKLPKHVLSKMIKLLS